MTSHEVWHGGLLDDLERVLFDAQTIERRVSELGREIASAYVGRDLLLVGILKGSFPFVADLARAMNVPLRVDFMSVSSYGGGTKSTGVVKILKDLDRDVEGADLLIVEDIVDSGLTLRYLLENLATRRPRSLAVCALLDKVSARVERVELAFTGFVCPDAFVVGYGLDYQGRYRNLPHIGVLRESIYRDADA